LNVIDVNNLSIASTWTS